MSRKYTPAEATAVFWSRVDKSGGDDACWPWVGSRLRSGYGTSRWDGVVAYTHRLAYTLAVAPIPPGRHVLHACDNPPCCNPRHLWTGDALENARDRSAKGRTARNRGERSGNAKLTDAAVVAIRADPRPSVAVAADYLVSEGTVRAIRQRKTWKDVE